MLIEFSVENFRSIQHEVTLTLEAGSIREREVDNVIDAEGIRVLKGAVVYGANASGKSNLIQAFQFLRSFVKDSSKESQQNEAIEVEPFRLSTETVSEPSMFEIVLLVNKVRYRYGFRVTRQRVVEEWLYAKKVSRAESLLFSRDNQQIRLRAQFPEGKGLQTNTRENALFLSVCAQLNGPTSTQLVNVIGGRLWILISAYDEQMWRLPIVFFHLQENLEQRLAELLKAGDLGISKLDYKRLARKKKRTTSSEVDASSLAKVVHDSLASNYEIFLSHKKRDKEGKEVGHELFDLFKEESEGTRKLFGLAGVALVAIDFGFTLVVDEFDARLHPIITKQLVNLFNSRHNAKGGQLIIATHDTNLLSYGEYRRDQIWFTEKDSAGATDLYSLVEYKTDEEKKIRKDASFEKDYIQGRYGGIPYLGDFQKLIGSVTPDVAGARSS